MKISSLQDTLKRERKLCQTIMDSYYRFLECIAKNDQHWILSIIAQKFPDIPDDVSFVSDYGTITLRNFKNYFFVYNPNLRLEPNVIFKHKQKNCFVHRKWKFWEDIVPLEPKEPKDPVVNPFEKYLLITMFQYVRSEDLLSCRLVCKDWKDGASHEFIWDARLRFVGSTLIGFKGFLKLNRDIQYEQSVLHMARCWIYNHFPEHYAELVPRIQCDTIIERTLNVHSIYMLMYEEFGLNLSFTWDWASTMQNAKHRKVAYIRQGDEIYTILWSSLNRTYLQYWKNARDFSQRQNWPSDKVMFEFSDNVRGMK